HDSVHVPVSDTDGLNPSVSDAEEPSKVNAPAPDVEALMEPITVNALVSEAEEPSTVNNPASETEDPSTIDVTTYANIVIDAPVSNSGEPEVVKVPASDAEELGGTANLVVVSDVEEASSINDHSSSNEEIASDDIPSQIDEKTNPIDAPISIDGIINVPVFVAPSSPVEKLTINTTITESVRSEISDDEIEADVKSDSPLCSEVSPPTSPSGSEASNKDGKESIHNL
ncbi:12107_t:CDS:1, partial [Acaulospora colombiana]